MTFCADQMQRDLQTHTGLCAALLELARCENQQLRDLGEFPPGRNDEQRKFFLGRCDDALTALRAHRAAWQKLPESRETRHPEIPGLIRAAQESALKVIVLDRENEQLLLRRGLLPARHLPAAPRPQPHALLGSYRPDRQNLP